MNSFDPAYDDLNAVATEPFESTMPIGGAHAVYIERTAAAVSDTWLDRMTPLDAGHDWYELLSDVGGWGLDTRDESVRDANPIC